MLCLRSAAEGHARSCSVHASVADNVIHREFTRGGPLRNQRFQRASEQRLQLVTARSFFWLQKVTLDASLRSTKPLPEETGAETSSGILFDSRPIRRWDFLPRSLQWNLIGPSFRKESGEGLKWAVAFAKGRTGFNGRGTTSPPAASFAPRSALNLRENHPTTSAVVLQVT